MDSKQPFAEGRKSHSMYNKVCILLAVGSVVQSIALIAVVLHWRTVRLNVTSPREHDTCVPATSLDLPLNFDPEENGRTVKDVSETEKMLCGKTSVIMSFMVEKAVKERGEEYDSRDLPMTPDGCTPITRDTPSGHVHGINFEEMKNGDDGILHWKSAKLSLKGGMEYTNGRFLVKDSGYYYISSQVIFSDTSSEQVVFGDTGSEHVENIPVDSGHNDGTFTHTVYKQSPGSDSADKLVGASKTLCEPLVDNPETTSATGTVFYLQGGDSVYIATSSPHKLIASDESNHFSLYRI